MVFITPVTSTCCPGVTERAPLPRIAYCPNDASTAPVFVSTIRWEPLTIFISRVGAFTTLLTVPESFTSLVMSYLGGTADVVLTAADCAKIGKANRHKARKANGPNTENRHFIVASLETC